MSVSVLLDLDGTLIDSYPGILASSVAALRALGHEPVDLELRSVIGPPIEDIMRTLLAPYGDDRVDQAVAAYREHYGASGYLGSKPYPGVRDALADLRRSGRRLFLATSKRVTFARRILETLEFRPFFEDVYGSTPGGQLDHKPALLAHILAQQAISPRDAVMIGDRKYDVAGAKAVEMRSIGVLWGYGSREELESAGANRIVTAPAELGGAVDFLR